MCSVCENSALIVSIRETAIIMKPDSMYDARTGLAVSLCTNHLSRGFSPIKPWCFLDIKVVYYVLS